jgi:predicted transcriptional regulator
VIIDRDGNVRYVHRGYLTGYETTYEKQIRELLK